MSKYILAVLCCLLLLVHTGSAQSDPIKFTFLSARDGLLSNSVNAILKDHYGLMWFATDDGLNKFDGTNFTVYRHITGDSNSLRANEILALHEDRNGNLWIGTSGGGLSKYDRKRDAFVHYPLQAHTQELPGNAVIMSICSDLSGKVWIAQFEYLFVFDPSNNSLSRLKLPVVSETNPLPASPVCVFADSKQRIWTGTNNGLYLYTGASTGFKKYIHDDRDSFSLMGNKIRAITEDSKGHVWVGTSAGLCRLRPDGSGFNSLGQLNGYTSRLNSYEINCMESDPGGHLWIGTSQGLNILNTQTLTVSTYLPEENNIHSLTSKYIRCAYIDRQGIYWLGTFRGGINKYDKNLNLFDLKLSSAFREEGCNTSIVSSFAENRNGLIYFGTDGGGLYEFNRTTNRIKPVAWKLPVNYSSKLSILVLHQSRDNKLYIGTYGQGLMVVDPATGAGKHFMQGSGPDDLSGNDIFCIKEDRKGNIWIGTNGQGVNVLKNNKVIARYTNQPAPGAANEYLLPFNGYARAIEEDQEGNFWIGSHGGGVALFEPGNNRWTVYTQSNSKLPGDKIESMLYDSQGNLWVGTYGAGLSLFDKKRQAFITFSEKDGLQNTTIYQIVEDVKGQIWVTTNTGISSFDKVTKKFRNYTHYNGVQNNNFVHSSGLRLSSGELIFGGLQGFNYFDPSNLTINQHVPEVLLTDLRISNKSILAGEEAPIKTHISMAENIELAYKQNFALSFVALNYTIPRQNHYAYKLEGFDKDWNYTGTSNTASYTNLDPGEYLFHVKASNNDGVWSAKDKVIRIVVHPPFWRTTYAYLLYIAFIGGLLLFSRRQGIRRIRKKFLLEQERQEAKRKQELDGLKIKFLTNLSHDFRTPISLIMGPVEQLMAGEKAGSNLDKLGMVKRNARRLLNLVNQLLDFRKLEEHELKLQLTDGELVSFVKDASDSFRDFAERKHIHFEFASSISKLEARFDHDKMERILFNLLSNAFKFTLEGGTVRVEMEQPAQVTDDTSVQWVTIKVIDTGVGIPKEKQALIFERFFQASSSTAVLNQGSGIGLSITREFVKMQGGSLEVISEPGQGACFIIQLPLEPTAKPVQECSPALPIASAHLPETTAVAGAMPVMTAANGSSTDLPLVLLVEDNEDFRYYLKDNLRNNYKVIEASNGKEGWQKALAHHPLLIVSDVTMPEMDGIELLQKLKGDKRTSHIPVILLTAQITEAQQLAGLSTGANDYITKPFNFEVLHARIKNLLHLNSTLKNTYTRQIKVQAPVIEVESADEKLLNKIVSYLEENLTNSQLSVETLSKEVGMSRSSLYSKLLELTGETPVEYIRSYRLDKAAGLMEKSDMTIAEIAYQVGFSTPNYFARSFKNKFNMLPSEFITRMRKSQPNSDN